MMSIQVYFFFVFRNQSIIFIREMSWWFHMTFNRFFFFWRNEWGGGGGILFLGEFLGKTEKLKSIKEKKKKRERERKKEKQVNKKRVKYIIFMLELSIIMKKKIG